MQYIVIKAGGSVLSELPDSFYQNVLQLQEEYGLKPVIVHGGGPFISSLLDILGVKTDFIDGLRVTTEEVLDVVEMVLSGRVNKDVVRRLSKIGANAIGISGVDANLIAAEPFGDQKLGYVGQVIGVNGAIIAQLCASNLIPVISPLGIDKEGQRYNINADTAAGAIARELQARLCFVSDIPGVYQERHNKKEIFPSLTKYQAEELIQCGVITGGMIPKIRSAIDSLIHGVPEVVILDGFDSSSLIKFASGHHCGTRIISGG
ncbi:MAG: acetylglutamate kinase [Firmicutes bacterium]|nr:acetylglutamate kinase [Bacillota bacterium]